MKVHEFAGEFQRLGRNRPQKVLSSDRISGHLEAVKGAFGEAGLDPFVIGQDSIGFEEDDWAFRLEHITGLRIGEVTTRFVAFSRNGSKATDGAVMSRNRKYIEASGSTTFTQTEQVTPIGITEGSLRLLCSFIFEKTESGLFQPTNTNSRVVRV